MANELNAAQIDALLDLLSSDDDYRALFVRDLGKALERLPGKPAIPANVTPGSCLRPTQLASKEAIAKAKASLSQRMSRETHIPKILEP